MSDGKYLGTTVKSYGGMYEYFRKFVCFMKYFKVWINIAIII